MLKKLTVLVLLSLLACVPSVYAQHGHGHDLHKEIPAHSNHTLHGEHATHGFHNGIHLPSDAEMEKLGFDAKMIKMLHGLQEKYEDQSKALVEAVKLAEKGLMAAHDDEQVKEKTLHQAIDQYFESKGDLMKLHATAAVEAHEVMGDDLFQKIKKAHSDH